MSLIEYSLDLSYQLTLVTETFIVSFAMEALYNPRLQKQVALIKEIVDMKSSFEFIGDRFALEHLIRQNEVDLSNNMAYIQKIITNIVSPLFRQMYPSEVLEKTYYL